MTQTGVIMYGHFRLTSGKHSDTYLQCAKVLQYPDLAERLARPIADAFLADGVQVVAGPATGGIIVAHEVARALGARAVFGEREEGAMTLRRGFAIEPDERVLVVEDVLTTGGSASELVEAVRDRGGLVVGVGALVDRSGGKLDLGVPVTTLARIRPSLYEIEKCPLCADGIPAIKPGSRKV